MYIITRGHSQSSTAAILGISTKCWFHRDPTMFSVNQVNEWKKEEAFSCTFMTKGLVFQSTRGKCETRGLGGNSTLYCGFLIGWQYLERGTTSGTPHPSKVHFTNTFKIPVCLTWERRGPPHRTLDSTERPATKECHGHYRNADAFWVVTHCCLVSFGESSSSSGATTSLFKRLSLFNYFHPSNSILTAFCPIIYFHNP